MSSRVRGGLRCRDNGILRVPEDLRDNALEREALELMIAAHGDSEPERRQRLDAWQRRSPAHAAAMRRAAAHWRLLGQARDAPLTLRESARLAIDAHLASLLDHPRRAVLPLAIAAVLAFWLAAVLFAPFEGSADPAQTAAVVPEPMVDRFQTARGEQRNLTLDDGSRVWLDWETAIEVAYTDTARQLHLRRGKAFFAVAPDPARPFSVRIEEVEARAVSTEFAVHRRAANVIDVAVLEGRVAVTPAVSQTETVLNAAETLRVTKGAAGEIRSRRPAELGAWRDGLVIFENRALREALETLEPYTSYRIDSRYLLDPDRPVSGTFFVDKGDAALRALMQTYRLIGDVDADGTLTLRSARPARPR